MRAPRKRPAKASGLIWERPERVTRAAPAPLSREQIVRAAISLADQSGLGAVTLRKVGSELGGGPMRLYGHVSTKEELLELMLDAVYGEMILDALDPGGWREALRAIAQRTREVARRHRWFLDLLGYRPQLGPNALAHREASLAALNDSPGFAQIDTALQAVRTFHAYVIGALVAEANELRAERESGLDAAAWQAASWPYLQRMLETGRFPMLERVVHEATHPPLDVAFEEGLECVLDGIATRLAQRAR